MIRLCLLIFFMFLLTTSSAKPLVSFEQLPNQLLKVEHTDTIYIKNGTYSNIDLRLRSLSNGSVTILPESTRGVKIVGKCSIEFLSSKNLILQGFLFQNVSNDDIILITSSNNISIKDNYFKTSGFPATGSIVRIRNGSSNNKISNNTFDGNLAIGIVLMTSLTDGDKSDELNINNEIFANIFCNIPSVKSAYPKSNGNGMEAIQIGNGSTKGRWWDMNTLIYNNLFQNIEGDGSEIISIKSSGNKIYGNRFSDNQSGVTIRYGNRNIINGNVFNNTKRGLRVYGSHHVIKDNYFHGGLIGLQFPATNYKSNESIHSNGVFFQASENLVINNIFENQRSVSIWIGNNKTSNRKILPFNLQFINNSFSNIDDKKNFQIEDNFDKLFHIARFEKNKSVNRTINISSKSIRLPYEKSSQIVLSPVDPLKGKFVGASWLDPKNILSTN